MEYHKCRACEKQYETEKKDGDSEMMNKYIKWLGFCDIKCWDKLTDDQQTNECIFAYIHGDIRKLNNHPVL